MARPLLLLPLLVACGGSRAEVTGSAFGINFESVQRVFFGGPYIVITPTEDVDCETVAFVRQTYEEGLAPTSDNIEMLQFTYVAGDVVEGNKSIAQTDAEVTSLLLATDGTQMEFDRATAGAITIDTLREDASAVGSFESVAFSDGSLSGEFTAEWCRNLRDR